MQRLKWIFLSLVLLVSCAVSSAADFTTYGAARDFLVAHTKVVELTGESGERVAVCPDLQGRIMTSTTGDLEGRNYGWINRSLLEAKDRDPKNGNIGGEDRFWLAPEGGQFGLCFSSPTDQKPSNYAPPAALIDGPYKIASGQDEPYYKLTRTIQVQNASKTPFQLDVVREIHLQKAHHFSKLFGSEAHSALQSGKLKLVGFQTINSITNRGPAMVRDKGLVAIASVGQFPAGPRTFALFPYKDGAEAQLGPAVNSDYFGSLSSDRLRINSQGIFFLGDGKFRSKIGVPQTRAKQVMGAIDLTQNLLTLIHYTMPSDPASYGYADQAWGKQAEPFRGDVATAYNDGPAEGRSGAGGYLELASYSPAAQLPTGKSISHTQSTFHIEGDSAALARVAKAALGIDVRVEEVANEKSKR